MRVDSSLLLFSVLVEGPKLPWQVLSGHSSADRPRAKTGINVSEKAERAGKRVDHKPQPIVSSSIIKLLGYVVGRRMKYHLVTLHLKNSPQAVECYAFGQEVL